MEPSHDGFHYTSKDYPALQAALVPSADKETLSITITQAGDVPPDVIRYFQNMTTVAVDVLAQTGLNLQKQRAEAAQRERDAAAT